MQPLDIAVDDRRRVSALLEVPDDARACLVLAHGAGAGMTHPFMADAARELAERGIATLRYQFPYMEQGSKRPDTPAVAQATVRAAVAEAARRAPALRLFAGGKPSDMRARHLADVKVPMLFLQGTRDGLADLALLRPAVERLRPRAALEVFEDADHSFHVRARSGRTDAQARAAMLDAVALWIADSQGRFGL
jgi:hypothetical protein